MSWLTVDSEVVLLPAGMLVCVVYKTCYIITLYFWVPFIFPLLSTFFLLLRDRRDWCIEKEKRLAVSFFRVGCRAFTYHHHQCRKLECYSQENGVIVKSSYQKSSITNYVKLNIFLYLARGRRGRRREKDRLPIVHVFLRCYLVE